MLNRQDYPELNRLQNELATAFDTGSEPSINAVGYLAGIAEQITGLMKIRGYPKYKVARAGRMVLFSEIVNRPISSFKHLTAQEIYRLTQYFVDAHLGSDKAAEVLTWLFANEKAIIKLLKEDKTK